MSSRFSPTRLDSRTQLTLFGSVGIVLALFIGMGIVTFRNTLTLSQTARQVAETHETLLALGDLLSYSKDAETGQRGFVITGSNKYLEPYDTALIRINDRLQELEERVRDIPEQAAHLIPLRAAVRSKLDELAQTIAVRRSAGFEEARGIVETDRGKAAMDQIRNEVLAMQEIERNRRARRLDEADAAYQIAVTTAILTGITGVGLVGVVGYLVWLAVRNRQLEDWLRMGQLKLSDLTVGDPSLQKLGEALLRFLAEYLEAKAGAFFVKDGTQFRRVATYGVAAEGKTPHKFEAGDGLLGQAVQDARSFQVDNLPDGYLTIGSALGGGNPRHLLITPAEANDEVVAVFELGFLHPIEQYNTELVERIAGIVGSAVQSANYRAHLQNLVEETQRQAEELQSQSEELRVSNEELEEQSRVLKDSQARLEEQQAELEQTNLQLERQAELLEEQRNEANRARVAVQQQSAELERASQYKSDFLANMSHELRTPLNSSLILAKLLADNRDGNLTPEQVQYAETIRSSGNDLLTLINDILDLSKIEAGHMEVRAESMHLGYLVEGLTRVFQPVAASRGIEFRTSIAADCPEHITTDRQRIEQILKNLLSNALKFTEQGQVSLDIKPEGADRIALAVTDSGIGIYEDQQQLIFEAFRQADGTIARKYGGTGLGLSISRELTQLLGGEIKLVSEVGRGSTFTVILPMVYHPAPKQSLRQSQPATQAPAVTLPVVPDLPAARPTAPPIPAIPISAGRVNDDRGKLSGKKHLILVVEDDEPFARILYELTHEQGFECVIASSAEEGVAVATRFRPHAIVLDVGLPDHSGLAVLDQLKHDPRTRHIPIHVVSASDYARTALQLGAVGYMLKPVKREELVDALQRLEDRISQRMRRVLIVEDDAVQRESVGKLLDSRDVETIGVGTAAECLDVLRTSTIDCMVLDLSLPDASGYSLLETLSQQHEYAFPPVIVYTGRELSPQEEQELRRYSRSIIIKGAKSPERLLDEVTLFLHQVVSELPAEHQRMLEQARSRDAAIEGRRILIVEDDVRNVFALTSILEPQGAIVKIARNGKEALDLLEKSQADPVQAIDLVLMDVMMPEMDGITATREIRKRTEWRKLPIIMLTAKAMKNDQEHCLSAGANDYVAKPLDVEKLLSLIRVWMPR